MTTGLVTLNLPSAKSNEWNPKTVIGPNKTTTATQIINYPANFNGLANSVLIDNQDGSLAVTVRLNRATAVITIPSAGFRAFNDSWIEQIDLTGTAADVQVTAQVVGLAELGLT